MPRAKWKELPVEIPAGVERLLSIRQVCAVLSISATTYYEWLNDKETGLAELLVHLPGGVKRYPADELRRWYRSFSRRRALKIRKGGADETGAEVADPEG